VTRHRSADARDLAAPSLKQRPPRCVTCSIRTGQVVPANPAASVRGPQHIVKGGKTPVLDPAEARAVLDSIDVMTPAGLRDQSPTVETDVQRENSSL
jgi:integrase/recombinase XerC